MSPTDLTAANLQSAGDVLRALKISCHAPADRDLLALLDLAAASQDVAAFLAAVIAQPGVAIVANFDPPPDLVRCLSAQGLDWSKFFHLIEPVVSVCAVLDRLRPPPRYPASGSIKQASLQPDAVSHD